MTCDRTEPLLGAYADGACIDEEADLVVRHLETCPDCRKRLQELEEMTEMLRRSVVADEAPPELWASVQGTLDEEDARVAAMAPRWSGATLRRFAIAASVILMVAVSLSGSWWPASDPERVVHEAVNDFITYRLSNRELDVASGNPGANKDWFKGKIAFRLPAVKAEVAGFELRGSRLCWLLDRRLSALTYEKGGHLASLYVMSGHGLKTPEADFEPAARADISVHRIGGLTSVVWRRDGLVFALVSDLPVGELLPFTAALNGPAHAGLFEGGSHHRYQLASNE
ncbi:MAG: anti-sigma factor family protein [Methyloligellaceae bacterium]